MNVFLRDKPLERKHCGIFKFLTGHVYIDHPNEVKNYRAVLQELQYKTTVVFHSLDFAASHSILCVLHARDYVIRDWRSLPVFPIIYDRLMERSNVHFLTTITIFDVPRLTNLYANHAKRRPYFPFRSTIEASFFLINRDIRGTYQKWASKEAVMHMRRLNVWKSDTILESFTPNPEIYRTILELFCHPEFAIYDVLPHDGGFAIASVDVERFYVGVFQKQQLQKVQRRITSLREVYLHESINRPISASDSFRKIKKAGCVSGWRSRVRKD